MNREDMASATEQLELIQAAAAALGRDDYLDRIVGLLGRALGVRWAFASEVPPEHPGQARTLAFFADGVRLDDMMYDLAGTPCADVYDRSSCLVTCDVQTAYPDDHMLGDIGAESYAALPFYDAAGRAIGHLGIMHSAPLPADVLEAPVFAVFAAFVGAEIARRGAEAERRRVSSELMARERRESLGLMVGTIAHDLNNLLVGITANVGLAEFELPPAHPARPFLTSIQDTGQYAAALAKQMLAYSGRGRFELGAADAGQVVREIVTLVRPRVPPAVSLRTFIADDASNALADGTQLRQLVMNLVLNAVEALDGDAGEVAVRVTNATFDPSLAAAPIVARSELHGPAIAIEVADTGPGMSPATVARVFDPFFTTKASGNGLGLAAVVGIVEGHSGVLQLSSELGQGTTFRALLPVSEAVPEPVVAPTAPTPIQGLHALVVDDSEPVRNVLSAVLQRSGADVAVAVDGVEALTLLEAATQPFHVVITDLSMPRLGGDELVFELQTRAPGVPILLMSGTDRAELSSRVQEGAGTAFLHKPFTVPELLAALDGALSRPGPP